MDLSSGDWLTVGPSMGSWSSILSFGSLCRSSVIMLILVLIGSFLDLSVRSLVSLFGNSASGDTESKRSVS